MLFVFLLVALLFVVIDALEGGAVAEGGAMMEDNSIYHNHLFRIELTTAEVMRCGVVERDRQIESHANRQSGER